MPVVEVPLAFLTEVFPNKSIEDIITSVPLIGLDIEGRDDKIIRLEYNPNRPDFSSYIGIVRALKGYFGLETGIPKFRMNNDKRFRIDISSSKRSIRPYIRALVAKNTELDKDLIKMLIDMQEDLHTGICNKRKAASIGLHNLEKIRFPLRYSMSNSDIAFVPLDFSRALSLKEILSSTNLGKKYSHLLTKTNEYPILLDAENQVVSFPPIVNSRNTILDDQSNGIFVEVTAIDPKVADLVIAIYAATLHDMKFRIYHVILNEPDGSLIKSPDMNPTHVSATFGEINRCIGIDFPREEIVRAAARSRLGIKYAAHGKLRCTVPKYRNDVREVRDLIEEVLVGLGLLEIRNYVIVSKFLQFDSMGLKPEDSSIFHIENSLVSGHDTLRNSLLPSLINTLGHNIHSPYPQNIFEIGKVFEKEQLETEKWHLCVALAHTRADYTSIKSVVQTFMKIGFGKDVLTSPSSYSEEYAKARSASIIVDGSEVGKIGEISDLVRQNHKIRVPVAAYEMDLSPFLRSFRRSM